MPSKIFHTKGNELRAVKLSDRALLGFKYSPGLNILLLPRLFRDQRFFEDHFFRSSLNCLALSFWGFHGRPTVCEMTGSPFAWAETIENASVRTLAKCESRRYFRKLIDHNQSRSFTVVSVLPFFSTVPVTPGWNSPKSGEIW